MRRAVLASLALVVVVASGALATSVDHYDYDGLGTAAGAIVDARPNKSVDQGEWLGAGTHRPGQGTYDDASNLARTFARPGGYRLAPNTALGAADDVLALPRGGANLSQQRLDHIVERHWFGSQTTGAVTSLRGRRAGA